jgi:hypothetical protein
VANEKYLERTIAVARDFVEDKKAESGKTEVVTEGLGFNTGRQSLETPLVEIPELVNNWVRIGDISLLVGFGGVGKSTIALNLALALAGGVPFIGYAVNNAERVAYMDLEMGEYEFRTRLNMLLSQHPEAASDNLFWKCLSNFTLKDKRNEARLRNELAAVRPKLLVIDNHASFHGGDPNRENEMMVNVITPLREIMAEFGLGILYLMHTPWTEKDRPRGTAAIFDAAATVVAVTKPQSDTRKLTWTKRRSVRSSMGAAEIDVAYNAKTLQVRPSVGSVVDEALSSITFPAKRAVVVKQLAEALGITDRGARYKVEELEKSGLLMRKGDTVEMGFHRISDYVTAKR